MTALLRHDNDKKFLEHKRYYPEKQGNFSWYSFSEYRPEILKSGYPELYLYSYVIPMET